MSRYRCVRCWWTELKPLPKGLTIGWFLAWRSSGAFYDSLGHRVSIAWLYWRAWYMPFFLAPHPQLCDKHRWSAEGSE
jgi:hypothetical protein